MSVAYEHNDEEDWGYPCVTDSAEETVVVLRN